MGSDITSLGIWQFGGVSHLSISKRWGPNIKVKESHHGHIYTKIIESRIQDYTNKNQQLTVYALEFGKQAICPLHFIFVLFLFFRTMICPLHFLFVLFF